MLYLRPIARDKLFPTSISINGQPHRKWILALTKTFPLMAGNFVTRVGWKPMKWYHEKTSLICNKIGKSRFTFVRANDSVVYYTNLQPTASAERFHRKTAKWNSIYFRSFWLLLRQTNLMSERVSLSWISVNISVILVKVTWSQYIESVLLYSYTLRASLVAFFSWPTV